MRFKIVSILPGADVDIVEIEADSNADALHRGLGGRGIKSPVVWILYSWDEGGGECGVKEPHWCIRQTGCSPFLMQDLVSVALRGMVDLHEIDLRRSDDG